MSFLQKPAPGPLYSAIVSTWGALDLPKVPAQYTTWIPESTPLSTQKEIVAAIGTYLLVVFGGKLLMKNRAPFKLNTLFRIHNAFLVIISATVLVGILEEILPLLWNKSFFYTICSTKAFTPRVTTFYMINYWIKYVELLDTVFLVLKKKPTIFLHVYHHAATAVLCYTQIEGETAVQWVVISINLFVHIIMYYYYFATAGGARIWWKKYLTTFQIVQFVIDLFIIYFATYQHFAFAHGGGRFPVFADCAGAESAALFGCAIITSYLFLFVEFFINTYRKRPSSTAGQAAATAAKQIAQGSGPSGIRGTEHSTVVKVDPRGTVVITEVK